MSTDGAAITIDAPGFYEGVFLHHHTINGKKHYCFSYFNNKGDDMNIDYMMSYQPELVAV